MPALESETKGTPVSSSRPSSPARDAALIAVFAGFVAALGVVPAFQPPGFSVPITAQSLGVMLAGAILGARRGFAALALFLVLVAVGLPLLAGGRGGLGVFFTPSVGFLLAWPLTAYVIGWLTERGARSEHQAHDGQAREVDDQADDYQPRCEAGAQLRQLQRKEAPWRDD